MRRFFPVFNRRGRAVIVDADADADAGRPFRMLSKVEAACSWNSCWNMDVFFSA